MKKNAESAIADEAVKTIYGDRERTYGDPGRNIRHIAEFWSTYTGVQISVDDVCNMMIMVKLARLKHTPDHHDSLVDTVGYALLKEKIHGSRPDPKADIEIVHRDANPTSAHDGSFDRELYSQSFPI